MMDVGIYALQSAWMITGEEPTVVSAITTGTDPVKFKEATMRRCASSRSINSRSRWTTSHTAS